MTWIGATATGSSELDGVFGLCPDLYADYRRFCELLWSRRLVDPNLLELCRLRIVQLLGSDMETIAPPAKPELRAAKMAALDNWATDSSFLPVERACLGFAEKFVLNPHRMVAA